MISRPIRRKANLFRLKEEIALSIGLACRTPNHDAITAKAYLITRIGFWVGAACYAISRILLASHYVANPVGA
jgi:hypothetical protein